MKEYREGLNENKYLQKKKEILAHRQEVTEKNQEKNNKNKVNRLESPLKEHDRESRDNTKEMPYR